MARTILAPVIRGRPGSDERKLWERYLVATALGADDLVRDISREIAAHVPLTERQRVDYLPKLSRRDNAAERGGRRVGRPGRPARATVVSVTCPGCGWCGEVEAGR